MESGFYGFETLKLNTMITEKDKDLDYWKKNAEEDYMQVPISVLRYISELEEVVKNCSIPDVVGRIEQLVCDECGDAGRTYPTLAEPDGVECEKCKAN